MERIYLDVSELSQASSGLALEISQIGPVKVGDVEVADTKPREWEHMNAANPGETSNGYRLSP